MGKTLTLGAESARLCPLCGGDTTELLCPHDDTPTISRVHLRPADLDFDHGQVVAGRYKLGGVLGRGGFGAVYQAHHLSTHQQLAIKFLAIDLESEGDSAIRRFFKEAKVTSQLTHPNTVRVYDFGQSENGALFMAMELLVGPTLERLLRDRTVSGSPLSEAEACDIGIAVLRSLAEAHAKDLVHRDLKPANIMIAAVPDEAPVVKVVDFGIARTRESSLTGAGRLGTPNYMSPEQCAGRDLDGRSDLYALGAVLFRCITGRAPFRADDPLAIMYSHRHESPPDPRALAPGKVSDAFAEVLLRALAKDPDARFADAKAMRQALEGVRGGAWAATPVRTLAESATIVTPPRRAASEGASPVTGTVVLQPVTANTDGAPVPASTRLVANEESSMPQLPAGQSGPPSRSSTRRTAVRKGPPIAVPWILVALMALAELTVLGITLQPSVLQANETILALCLSLLAWACAGASLTHSRGQDASAASVWMGWGAPALTLAWALGSAPVAFFAVALTMKFIVGLHVLAAIACGFGGVIAGSAGRHVDVVEEELAVANDYYGPLVRAVAAARLELVHAALDAATAQRARTLFDRCEAVGRSAMASEEGAALTRAVQQMSEVLATPGRDPAAVVAALGRVERARIAVGN